MTSEEKFKEMATSSKAAIEDFNDMADDRAISWAHDRLLLLTAENERLQKRDGNAIIILSETTETIPYHHERMKIIDFGVSDNIYIVERAKSTGGNPL